MLNDFKFLNIIAKSLRNSISLVVSEFLLFKNKNKRVTKQNYNL